MANAPGRKISRNILETIGHTPLVRINRLTQGRDRRHGPREDRDLQSGQLDQGPDGREDDRGCRKGGEAQAGRHDHRGHVGQHRHGAGHCGGRQGIPLHLHDDRQAVEGEGGRAQGVRRRRDRLPDRRRSRGPALLLFGVVAARARDPQRVEGQPVRQPVQHAGALRADRSRDLGADRRHGDAPGVRRRNRRHHHRRRPLSQGAQPRHQGVGDRHLRLGVQEVQGDRRLRQERDLSRTSPKASARTSCRGTWTSA